MKLALGVAVRKALHTGVPHDAGRLRQWRRRLPYRTREILRLVGDGELTGHEIGVLFGITPSRVSQIVSAAVAQVGVRIAAADTVAYPDRPPEPPLYRVTWPAGSLVG